MAKTTLPAMITADGVDIDVGQKVYTFEVSENWRDKTWNCFVNESEVIIDNRRARFFVVRCAKGCETKVKMQDGCAMPNARIFADKATAEKEAMAVLIKNIESLKEYIQSDLASIKKRKETIAVLKKLKVTHR